MTQEQKTALASQLGECLTHNILPYWLDRMIDPAGGFYGRRDGFDTLDAKAPKGAILNARLLWTFSAALRHTGNQRYREAADRAYDYIVRHFIDREFGGVYWSLNPDGTPADTKKQFYAIAFTIYGLAEYYRATGREEALEEAIVLFDDIERHSYDPEKGGYLEAATREWNPIDDMRLSDKDANSCKTMNTHLHILEAYTALLRVWPFPTLVEAQKRLLDVFLTRIMDSFTGHLGLFFDRDWHMTDKTISYGHDIEASWLLLEAAEVLGDAEMYERVLKATRRIADAALQGYCFDGSMVYERHASGSYDNEKHWWVQAETLVGLLWLAKYHGRPEALDLAALTWNYISANLIDREAGEWYWSRLPDGTVNRRDDKAGFWKCPYHNSRMCLEALSIL